MMPYEPAGAGVPHSTTVTAYGAGRDWHMGCGLQVQVMCGVCRGGMRAARVE